MLELENKLHTKAKIKSVEEGRPLKDYLAEKLSDAVQKDLEIKEKGRSL
jgi:gluconate kinase